MLTNYKKKYKGKRIKEFLKNVKESRDITIEVGVLDGTYPDGSPIAEVAFYLEYGTDNIDPEYFMTRALSQNKQELLLKTQKLEIKKNKGKITQAQYLKIMAKLLKEYHKKQIVTQGLVRSGRLLRAIDTDIVIKDSE